MTYYKIDFLFLQEKYPATFPENTAFVRFQPTMVNGTLDTLLSKKRSLEDTPEIILPR